MRAIGVVAVIFLAGRFYGTAGHGYVAMPPLRGGVAGNDDNGYCPQCGNGASACGDGGQWPPGSDFLNYGAETLTNLQAGSIHEFSVHITAHHMGHFEFAICDQHVSGDLADPQACFDARKLHRADPPADCVPNDARGDCQPIQVDYPERWYLPPSAGTHAMRFKIPSDLSCESCTLQWRWWTANSCLPAPNYGCFFNLMAAQGWNVSQWCGNNCGECGDYEPGHYTCGEEFRNCADVSVNGGEPVPTTTAGATTATNSATPTSSPATTATTSPSTGSCVWNRDCGASEWCNDPVYEAWCPQQGQNCPSPQCVLGDTTPPATTQAPSTTEATTTTTTQAPSTTEATTPATGTATSSEAPTASKAPGVCVWNRDCGASAWCNDPVYETWCPQQGQNCPSPQCVLGDTTMPPATTSSRSTTFLGTTTTTTTVAGGQECVSQAVLQCINDASSYWPKCSPSQSKEIEGPTGYEFGLYCTQEWADAVNAVLRDPLVGKCGNSSATQTMLAQIAYETGYFSTLFQPIDGGAGLIHMIPQNWPINVGHMDDLWPGVDYSASLASMQEKFFQTPAYGWKSVAAWYLRTNHVIPGCEGKNLFELDMDAQTRCILGRVVDRSEAYNIVGNCMATV
ncbi:ESV-like Lytic polysaccharide mono-oxygenase [Amphidinium carterae]